MTRKEFLRSVVGVGVGAASIAALAACGDDGGSSTADAAPAECTTPTNSITSNHGHVLMVSLADVNAGMAKTYDLTGTANHSHSLMVTAAQFQQLKDGQTLNLTSTSGGGHTHNVSVQCVS
ncbi:MAG: hypothetical protein AB7T06_33105 [Kofleriaceae bacterium]